MDTTNLTNLTNLQGLAYYTNNATDGVLFIVGMVVFFVIMLIVLNKRGEPFENTLAVSSWSMFIISLLFWFAKLIPTIVTLCFLVLAAISVLILKVSQ